MHDVANLIWCLLDDGPAAGAVTEREWNTREMLVAMWLEDDDGNLVRDEDGLRITVTYHYRFYGACSAHRIARYKWVPQPQ